MATTFWQATLTPPPSTSGIDHFCALARAYVEELGIDDSFRIIGRVRGADTREIAWCPGQGAHQLHEVVRDYQEYFESVRFPAPDPEVVGDAEPVGCEISASGVDLCMLSLHGDERLVARLEALVARAASAITPAPPQAAETPPASPASPRQRRLELYKATWQSRAATEALIEERLGDDDDSVAEAAASLCARYSLVRMVGSLSRLLGDPRPSRRALAVRTLRRIDEVAAIPATLHLLSDPEVRSEVLATLRHAAHLPWARRRHLLDELGAELEPQLGHLEPGELAQVLPLLEACKSAACVRIAIAHSTSGEPSVRGAALRTLATQSGEGVVEALIGGLERALLESGADVDEATSVSVVEALQRDELRVPLLQQPALLARLMAVLEQLASAGASPDADQGADG